MSVVPFKKKPRLSRQVKNILDSQPAYAADLNNFLRLIPEDDRIEAIETIVRNKYLGGKSDRESP